MAIDELMKQHLWTFWSFGALPYPFQVRNVKLDFSYSSGQSIGIIMITPTTLACHHLMLCMVMVPSYIERETSTTPTYNVSIDLEDMSVYKSVRKEITNSNLKFFVWGIWQHILIVGFWGEG